MCGRKDKPEPQIEPGEAVKRNLQALLLLAPQPAEINKPGEQGTAQGARKVQAFLRGVRVVPHRSPAGRDDHPERLQEGPALDSYRVPDLTRVAASSTGLRWPRSTMARIISTPSLPATWS